LISNYNKNVAQQVNAKQLVATGDDNENPKPFDASEYSELNFSPVVLTNSISSYAQ